ncbi:tryptophan--tRNA ligase [Fictibacillus sp. KIGAM418]|uniref:Tryptophan--tRNA ligase n=1 Tax=Fictibacillus marinisediminis TaxID=2878389 RepID=A0A9X1XE37_9BACL|nr:tryptophan--tRNA ligase [Fictibacillus marinisediminis]MCK6258421.1 tryptophan--tRNA ligase [Fictibacillus marinisediminis]
MEKKIVLTGIKSTGRPHIGNYIGAIKPALQLAENDAYSPYYFIADYHSLTTVQHANQFKDYVYGIAATWLALGLDPEKSTFYRQADVPEVLELAWILSCLTPKGLMNRAHAYKGLIEENRQNGLEQDSGINMGVFTYPILMAADILLFQSDIVPVGKDQIQHVEIARDIAGHFNHIYGETFKMPEYKVDEATSVVPGLDGRKMSKSYNNTIPLFNEEKELEKLIKRIETDSSLPEDPKDPALSSLFLIYKEFASEAQVKRMRERYENGVGWGEVKKELFHVMNAYLETPRQRYIELMNNPKKMDEILLHGAEKARRRARTFLEEVKEKIGC